MARPWGDPVQESLCDATGTLTCPPRPLPQPLPTRGAFCSSSCGPGARKGPPSRMVPGTRARWGGSSARGPFPWACLTTRPRGSGFIVSSDCSFWGWMGLAATGSPFQTRRTSSCCRHQSTPSCAAETKCREHRQSSSGWPTVNWPVLVNKVLLALSHAHLFMRCLCLLLSQKAESLLPSGLYRKSSLLPPQLK